MVRQGDVLVRAAAHRVRRGKGRHMRDMQDKVREPARWFRVGIVSATLLTPLVTRWQTLRAAERARELWEASQEATWPWTRKPAPDHLPPLARRANLSTGLWLAGVGVGLVLAGTGAYVIMRRRIAALEDEPLELRIAEDGDEDHVSDGQASAVSRANGNLEAPAVRAGEKRASEDARRTEEGVGMAWPRGEAAGAARAASTGERPDMAGEPAQAAPAEQREETGASTTLASGAPAGVVEPERARFIGNIHTMVYHEAGDENLPAEENRVYFASREEAEEAGFRPDWGEAPGL